MPLTPQDFVSKWKRVTAREKQIYQEHFIDLCHLTGRQTPNDYDPTGTRFGFEIGATKTSGGQGWKSDLSDDEILEKLLALNLERSNPGKRQG
jgi:hypothetical protein